MSDILRIKRLHFRGRHGVLAGERSLGQPFYVDLALYLDTRSAAGSDDLRDTIDYAAVAGSVRRVMEGPPKNLIETLAGEAARRLLEEFPALEAVQVTIHKPGAPIEAVFDDVSVEVFRRRGD